ncbi:hypothetical protein B9Z65_7517 [Elsinoe australis]|uniref:Uncharacterized protein n=1 Tax=Elsinoe australis TaxID=40998 RepID=A0A2P7YCE4_9PEZI|nr:hypothetical protein B9Z65_7517 [Elsinoe australis]
MAGSGTVTPPPSYSETLAPILTPMKFARRLPRRSEEKAAAVIQPTSSETITPTQKGIQWKFATQGLNLLSLSAQESTSSAPSTSTSNDTPFARQLYIHALTYLLRALPTNLSSEESTSLSAAIPASLLPSPPVPAPNFGSSQEPEEDYPSADSEDDDPSPFSRPQSPNPTPTSSPPLIQRLTTRLTLSLFQLLNLILPYLTLLATTLHALNKEHALFPRLASFAFATADATGRTAWSLSSALLALQHGRGVSGGVWEGVGEGLIVLGFSGPQGRGGEGWHRQGQGRAEGRDRQWGQGCRAQDHGAWREEEAWREGFERGQLRAGGGGRRGERGTYMVDGTGSVKGRKRRAAAAGRCR